MMMKRTRRRKSIYTQAFVHTNSNKGYLPYARFGDDICVFVELFIHRSFKILVYKITMN